MQIDTLGEVIATRELSVLNRPAMKVTVRIGKPQPLPGAQGDDCFCPWQIAGAGEERVLYAAGVDAFQAIWFALRMIGTEVAVINRELGGQLRWEADESGELGFPT